VESIALLDNLEFIEEVHPNYRVKISFDRAVEITPYAILRKKK
jgi:hypothetical protein